MTLQTGFTTFWQIGHEYGPLFFRCPSKSRESGGRRGRRGVVLEGQIEAVDGIAKAVVEEDVCYLSLSTHHHHQRLRQLPQARLV